MRIIQINEKKIEANFIGGCVFSICDTEVSPRREPSQDQDNIFIYLHYIKTSVVYICG